MGKRNTDPALCRAFVQAATSALASTSQVKHTLSVDADEDHCILDIPKAEEGGFDIMFEIEPDEITVVAEGAHFHVDNGSTLEETVQAALGLLRDLLSDHMRVRELRTCDQPYEWHLQSLRDGEWITEQVTSLFLRRFWGERSERIYQNRVLEGRLDQD